MPSLISRSPSAVRFLAFLCSAGIFMGLISHGLLAPLFSALITYIVAIGIANRLSRAVGKSSIGFAVSVIVATVALVLTAFGIGVHFIVSHSQNFNALMSSMTEILTTARARVPAGVQAMIPEQAAFLSAASEWIKENVSTIGVFSIDALRDLGLCLIGILVGAMIAVSSRNTMVTPGPVGTLMLEQVKCLRNAFWKVASAQLKISSLNTALTSLYLLVVMPMCGVHLPLAKTMVVVTFFIGLIPVAGNLISNTIITIISVSHSFQVAAGSLAFLVVIHKLEYFINARLVGANIDAKAHEILAAMLAMEVFFGIPGIVVAPVMYAWLKSEWQLWDVADEDRLDSHGNNCPSISSSN